MAAQAVVWGRCRLGLGFWKVLHTRRIQRAIWHFWTAAHEQCALWNIWLVAGLAVWGVGSSRLDQRLRAVVLVGMPQSRGHRLTCGVGFGSTMG